MKLKHKIALFAVYFTLFIALTAMIDYYAYDTISPWVFIVISIVGAFWATLTHAKSHQKTKADELAHDIEKIL
jgi:F0F1-type ATP synthase assembly protein I